MDKCEILNCGHKVIKRTTKSSGFYRKHKRQPLFNNQRGLADFSSFFYSPAIIFTRPLIYAMADILIKLVETLFF